MSAALSFKQWLLERARFSPKPDSVTMAAKFALCDHPERLDSICSRKTLRDALSSIPTDLGRYRYDHNANNTQVAEWLWGMYSAACARRLTKSPFKQLIAGGEQQ